MGETIGTREGDMDGSKHMRYHLQAAISAVQNLQIAGENYGYDSRTLSAMLERAAAALSDYEDWLDLAEPVKSEPEQEPAPKITHDSSAAFSGRYPLGA